MTIKFGTDGWRAIMCDTFTFSNVRLVVQAIADFLNERGLADKGVFVGYDARFLSDRFAKIAAEVLAGNGIHTLMPGRDTPTPVTAFTAVNQGLAGAVMFTASHNPAEYNGIKWIPEYGGPASPDITAEFERNISVLTPDRVKTVKYEAGVLGGLIESFDPMPEYMSRLGELVDLESIARSGLRIVYDPMFAVGRGYLDEVLRSAGAHITTINSVRDPLFGGGSPDPVDGRLGELKKAVLEAGADLGLATDGDADRFGAIDSDGSYINANQAISLLLVHLIENRKRRGMAVRSVATTHLIDRIARGNGMNTLETPVGFKYICEAMRNEEVIIGGEESGGLSIGGHVPEKDGILAGLLLAEARAAFGKSLGGVLNEINRRYGPAHSRRIDVHLSDDAVKARVMRTLEDSPPSQVAGIGVRSVSHLDGIKVVLNDESWFLLRASGTEPVIRLYGEAGNPERLGLMLGAVKEILGLEE